MAYLPLALSPLVVLGAAQPGGWAARVARALVAGAAVGILVVLTSAQTIMVALRAPMASHSIAALPSGDWQLLLLLLAGAVALHRWLQPPWLSLLGIVSLLCLLATQNSFLMHPMQKLSYQRLFWPGMLLGAAPLLPARLQGRGWALSSAAVVALLLFVSVRPSLDVPTTEQLEYGFLAEVLGGMPPDCTLAGVSRAGKRVWDIPSYLAPGASAQRNVSRASDLEAAPGDCLLYVRSSLCTSVEARALCEAVEREARLQPLASRVFPATPSYAGLPYDRAQVEVAVFRVTGHRAGVSDGVAITPAFAQALYDRLIPLQESDGCRVVELDTSRFRISVALRTPAGEERTLELASAPPGGGARSAGGWAIAASAEADRDCSRTRAAIERTLGELGSPAAVGAMEPTG